jgi:hypothetical protein
MNCCEYDPWQVVLATTTGQPSFVDLKQYVCLDFKIIKNLYIFEPASALKLKIADKSS